MDRKQNCHQIVAEVGRPSMRGGQIRRVANLLAILSQGLVRFGSVWLGAFRVSGEEEGMLAMVEESWRGRWKV